MRLSPEQFEQITGCKESALEKVGPHKAGDPRQVARLPLAFRTVACRLKDGNYERPVPVQVCDISVLGVGLTHAAESALGKKFTICMKSRTGNQVLIPLQCETVDARPVRGALVRVEATFCALEDTQVLLRALNARPTPPPPPAPAAPAAPAAVIAGAAPPTGVPGPKAPPPRPAPPVAPQPPRPHPATSAADEIKRIRDAMLS